MRNVLLNGLKCLNLQNSVRSIAVTLTLVCPRDRVLFTELGYIFQPSSIHIDV